MCSRTGLQNFAPRWRSQADIGGEMLKISYAAGWADYIPGESPEELLGRADKALYVNKRIAKGQDNRSVVSA